MKYIDLLESNRQLEKSLTGPKYKIAVVSNITINQIKEPLEFILRQEGINAEVTIGSYDNIIQDCEHYSTYNAVIVFWEAINFTDGFQSKALNWTPEQLSETYKSISTAISLLANYLARTPLVLINRFSTITFNTNVLRKTPLHELCDQLNEHLASSVPPSTIIVDTNAVIAKIGLHNAVDFRRYHTFKALYTPQFFKNFAEAVKPAFMAVTGHTKKVLVLDCDNTLWAGILGEDGENGIDMGPDSPQGKVFHEVQNLLLGYKKQGVILAICSKNNPLDLENVLKNHPEMVLRHQDFAALKINWRDKSENIRELAKDLNLGLDSFVFLDDSEFEIGLVHASLPQVKCILVPKHSSEYPTLIREVALLFFSLSQTTEDINKTELYLQNIARVNSSEMFTTTDDYLRSLQLKLTMLWDLQVPIARAAQMSQKTNQFNLTTPRYTEAEIIRMQQSPEYHLGAFALKDCYGEYGISGLAVVRQDRRNLTTAEIECFLMSCRVIGRQVEYCFIQQIIFHLKSLGIQTLRAKYLASSKNNQVADFYDILGFTVVSYSTQSTDYQLQISDFKITGDIYIELAP